MHVCNVRDNDLWGEANGNLHQVFLQKNIEANDHVRLYGCPILQYPKFQHNQQHSRRLAARVNGAQRLFDRTRLTSYKTITGIHSATRK